MKNLSNKKIIQYVILFVCIGFILKYFLAHREELALIQRLKAQDLLAMFFIGILIHVLMSYKMFFTTITKEVT